MKSMNRSKRYGLMVIIAFLVLGAFSSAHGQIPITAEEPNRWQFSWGPYAWLNGITGDIMVKGNGASVNESFSDLAKHLDLAFSSHIEVQKDRWSIFLDPWYAKMSDEGPLSLLDVTMKQYIVEVGGTYRILTFPIGKEPYSKLGIEGLVGGRYWNTDVKLEYPMSDTDKSKDWFDPIIGVRFKLGLLKNLSFQLRGDIGGFNVGSKFTWNTEGLLIYDISSRFSIKLGYRALGIDYESGSGNSKFKYDVIYYGPVLGLVVKF